MNFRELPISVQNIAAQLLADRMPCATNTSENEPAMALAQNISDAFTKLYNPMKTYIINYDPGRPGPVYHRPDVEEDGRQLHDTEHTTRR